MSSDDRNWLMRKVLAMDQNVSVPYFYPRLFAVVSTDRRMLFFIFYFLLLFIFYFYFIKNEECGDAPLLGLLMILLYFSMTLTRSPLLFLLKSDALPRECQTMECMSWVSYTIVNQTHTNSSCCLTCCFVRREWNRAVLVGGSTS